VTGTEPAGDAAADAAGDEGGDFQEGEGPDGLRLVLDREACIGAAECVAVAPAVFELDGGRRVRLLDPQGAPARAIRRAAERCPTDAIILEDARGEQLYP
jgi:ferredoxin